jgi:GntR family transcriptional regulator
LSDVPLDGLRELDGHSTVPLYSQLGEILKERLESGSWPAGAAFPTEREIEERFGVSRSVVRGAFDLLVADGAITRKQGSGTFVAPPKLTVPVIGLVKALLDRPDRVAITILSVGQQPPDRVIARQLDMGSNPPGLVQVSATLHVDHRPACFIDSYTSMAHIPWMLPAAEALKSGREQPKHGPLELTGAQTVIEGSGFGHWGASLLEANPGDVALVGRRIQYGRPEGSERELALEFARIVYRVNRVQLTFDPE